MWERIKSVQRRLQESTISQKELKDEYEKIYRDMYRGCISAETKYVNQKRSQSSCSKALDMAAKEVRYWKLKQNKINKRDI